MSPLLIGLLLGVRHALDADHIVAVTAIVSRERTLARAARVGAMWGIGHSLTVLVAGGLIICLRLAIAPRVALAFEFIVALMLIVIGVLNVRDRHEDKPVLSVPPILVGIVHGLAGTAAIALLVLAAIPSAYDGIGYLAVFGAGTMVGMTVVTVVIGAPTVANAPRMARWRSAIRMSAGVLSLALGVMLAYDIGIERGLFTATPIWAAE